jgi:hypothetical protein
MGLGADIGRKCAANYVPRHASGHELDLPRDRQAVATDNPVMPTELASREKTAAEVEAIMKYLGRK